VSTFTFPFRRKHGSRQALCQTFCLMVSATFLAK
jgi:hypothetical protein